MKNNDKAIDYVYAWWFGTIVTMITGALMTMTQGKNDQQQR